MSPTPDEIMAYEPDRVWRHTWAQLSSATRNPRHAFRLPVVASLCPRLGVRARTVVLRAADPGAARLTFFTDRRSGKVEGLGIRARLSWCFYDRRHRIQVRAETDASVHAGDEAARLAWELQGPAARDTFGVEPGPGRRLLGELQRPEGLDPDAGFENFATVVCEVEELDWLILGRAARRRLRFEPTGESGFRGRAVVP